MNYDNLRTLTLTLTVQELDKLRALARKRSVLAKRAISMEQCIKDFIRSSNIAAPRKLGKL